METADVDRQTPREPTMLRMLVASYRALPGWKKALMIASTLFIWPWMLFIATITALSSIPIFLFGRWEGELGKRPLLDEAEHLVRRRRTLTHHYYAA
jgi:hypothetical protein